MTHLYLLLLWVLVYFLHYTLSYGDQIYSIWCAGQLVRLHVSHLFGPALIVELHFCPITPLLFELVLKVGVWGLLHWHLQCFKRGWECPPFDCFSRSSKQYPDEVSCFMLISLKFECYVSCWQPRGWTFIPSWFKAIVCRLLPAISAHRLLEFS